MSSFAVSATIKASQSSVWATLADIGTIAEWNPGVVISRVTSDQTEGKGASRYCQLPGNAFLEERVVEWDPNSRLTFRIIDSNLPFKTADIRFTLDPRGSATLVTVSNVRRTFYSFSMGLDGRTSFSPCFYLVR